MGRINHAADALRVSKENRHSLPVLLQNIKFLWLSFDCLTVIQRAVYHNQRHIFSGAIILSSSGVISSENSLNLETQAPIENPSLLSSIRRYELLGAIAACLLSLIEWLDLQIQLTPVFASFTERIVFTSYFGLNILVGATLGLLLGLFVHATSFLKGK